MTAAASALVAALLLTLACVIVSHRARSRMLSLAPPRAEVLLERARESSGSPGADPLLLYAELDLERREVFVALGVLLLRVRAAARIALASGTACALVALSAALAGDFATALGFALGCFSAGALASLVAAQLGRMASAEQRQLREEWNRRCGEATQLIAGGSG